MFLLISVKGKSMNHIRLIEEIYLYLNKVCEQNKKELPPNSNSIYLELESALKQFEKLFTSEVVLDIKRNLWHLWRKELLKANKAKKRGFTACFVMAVEKSIPLTLEDVMTAFVGLDETTQDFFEIAEAASRSYLKVGMIFQYGSVRTMKIFSQNISKSDFKSLCGQALHRANKDNLQAIDWWNYICKWVNDFTDNVILKSDYSESEVDQQYPVTIRRKSTKRHPFEAIDFATDH